MTFLPDGRAFIIGGTEQYDPFYGDSRATIFDPATEQFAAWRQGMASEVVQVKN
jgi:hypothetical protein